MSYRCEVTGRKALKGNQVSHAMNHQIKFQKPNLRSKRFWIPGENRWVTLRVSSRGIRTINKLGISVVLAEMVK